MASTVPGLPGSSMQLSKRALPYHPGVPCGCYRSLLHHIREADHTHMCNEAEPGSLSLGLTRSQSGRVTSVAPRPKAATDPLPVIGYPDTGGRCYILKHQGDVKCLNMK